MLSEEGVIGVRNLSKSYHIWSTPLARLRGPFCQRLSEQPFLPAGLRQRLRQDAENCRREFFALHDVSFDVRRRHSLGIIGRNGSGKSTLLQIITGVLRPTTGEVEVRGRVAALLELGSGFNPEFTGRENVRLNAALHGLTPAEIDGRIEEMLAFADIGDFVDQPVKTYSSGMMLRLAFSVIAHIDADILIIDEALAVGDVFFMQKCMTFLRRFQEEGVLLLVSHNAAALTALCQHALWLDQGRLRLSGTPKEVTEAYMAAFFEADAAAKLGPQAAERAAAGGGAPPAPEKKKTERCDQRRLYLNHTQYRNDLQIFEFDPLAPSFGAGGGRVLDIALEDEAGRPLAWVVGGEVTTLRIHFESLDELTHPIVGFYVKNRLGQQLFGDNTFFSSQGQDLHAQPHTSFEAYFTFQMPILPPGDYAIAVALANGTQVDHVIHHWIQDALAFKSTASSLRAGGLVGLPMLELGIRRGAARPHTAAALA